MKKLLAIILSALLLTALVACSAEDADKGNGFDDYKDTTVEETQWTDKNKNTFYFEAVDSESITITGFSTTNSKPHAVALPATMHGKYVVGISAEAFANASEIKSFTLPAAKDYKDNVPEFTIAEGAFRGCFALEAVKLPAYVTSIGAKAFYGCESIKTLSFEAGSTLSVIPESAFQGCVSLTALTIPGNVERIDKAAFFGCTALTSLTLEEGVKELGDQAFQNCSALETVKAPKSLVTVGKHAFAGCNAIKSASIPTWFISEIEKSALVEVTLIAGESIPASAFKSCDALTTVTLNTEIKEIGEYAFVGCRSLAAFTIPDAITSIGNSTFKNCSSLAAITLPAGITAIGNDAFSGCDALTEIVIPAAVATIGNEAFASCDKLASITVAEGNKNFVDVDGHLYNLEKTVLIQYAIGTAENAYTVPAGVVEIKSAAFENSMTLVTLVIPDSVKTIGKSALAGCANLENATLPAYAVASLDKTSLKALTVTSGTEIEAEVLANAKLLETVTLADTIASIGDGAFSGCVSLKSFVLPTATVKIGNNVFYGCAAMTAVTLHSEVNGIGNNAFYGCAALEAIEIPAAVTSIGDEAFRGCASLEKIVLSKNIASIGTLAFSECASIAEFEVSDENAVYSSLNKDLYSKDGALLIQYAIGKADTETPAFAETVKEIAAYAFLGAKNLTAINVPATVMTIGEGAFEGCVKVTSATVPVWAIGKFATDSLEELYINAGEEIGENAFANCESLKKVTLAKSVVKVDKIAFDGCVALAAFEVEEESETFKAIDGVLYSKDGATLLIYPSALAESSFVIPEGVTAIAEGAFKNAKNLITITVSKDVKSIGAAAFEGCARLIEILNLSETLIIRAGQENGGIAANKYANVYKTGESKVSVADDFILFTTVDVNGADVVLLVGYVGDATEVTLPENVTEIAAYAFANTSVVTFHVGMSEEAWNGFPKADTWADGIEDYTVEFKTAEIPAA